MDALTHFFGHDKAFYTDRDAGFTAEEIAQQPRLWTELGTIMAAKQGEIASFLARTGDLKKRRIVFTGAGSSAFIGDALAPLVGNDAGLHIESVPTTDIVSAPDSYLFADIPTLLVSFARSGNSPESVGAVNYARAIVSDLYEVAITCDPASKLYDYTSQSDKSLILVMPEGSNDKGFAMTSSVSCMLLAGYLLFAGDASGRANGGSTGGGTGDSTGDLLPDIDLLAQSVSAAASGYAEVAQRYAERDFDRIAFLGSGFLKSIAHEASLKMMELTNGIVNGSFESSTGFRHGPKSVIKDKTITVHLVSPDPFTARYDLDLLREVYRQKKQNLVIAIGGEDAGELVGDEILRVATQDYRAGKSLCVGLEMLVFCQIFALYTSLSLGITTDNPSPTGEVNRVVQGVTVYELPTAGTDSTARR